ncbi:hypothetical protein [Trueperella abortisuis]|uniref:hypothetical protein n=1 Tax=Trueperella abortisuis TaxID=445930 RepID=UPI002892E96C|nr:hypothetical protein [Trueperella abortisuis]
MLKLKRFLFFVGIVLVLISILLTIASMNSSYVLNVFVDGMYSESIETSSGFGITAFEKTASFTKYLSYGVFSGIIGTLSIIASKSLESHKTKRDDTEEGKEE